MGLRWRNMNTRLALGDAVAPDKGCSETLPVKWERNRVFVRSGLGSRTAQHARALPTSASRLLRQWSSRNDTKRSSPSAATAHSCHREQVAAAGVVIS